MDKERLLKILSDYKEGKITDKDITERLNLFYLGEMEDITLDNWRAIRTGFPEVIYGASKTPEQIEDAVKKITEDNKTILITRISSQVVDRLKNLKIPIHYNERAKTVTVRKPEKLIGHIAIVTAGTGDIPVAEEAAETAEAMGVYTERIYDVGVAGLHRILSFIEILRKCDAVVVVAGMEGALPSVVAGLINAPVIAVPTSIGYGANLNGLTPLLGMLNSCSAGVSVVNIDNGFSAGYQAALISKKRYSE